MKKQFLLFVLMCFIFYCKVFPQNVCFYVVAHQDDWQIFRGDQAYADYNYTSDVKIVFIYTTSGDAGATDGWWEARE